MLVTLYNFPKRANSTKEPNPNQATALNLPNVELKEGTSFLNPTLLISPKPNPNQVFSPTQYNYASIPYWMRYYFIKDWRWVNGIWEVDLTVDVLASFKETIGETEAYILRSASSYDGSIVDSFYPADTSFDIQTVDVNSPFYGVSLSTGSFVLGVINDNPTYRIGAVTYYVVTNNQLNNFMRYILSSNIYDDSGITDIDEGLFKSMFNPMQYVVSCMWFPFDIYSDASTTIHLGYWDTNVSAKALRTLVHNINPYVEIPDHPQLARGSYLNYSPYTKLTLYLPPFGSIPIDTSFRRRGDVIYPSVTTDLVTGQSVLRIANCTLTDAKSIYISAEKVCQMGVSIQLSQVASDYLGVVTNSASALGNSLSLNVSGIFQSVANAMDAAMPKVSSSGTNSSFIVNNLKAYLICEFAQIVDENRAEFGRPLCTTRQINTLRGYIKCGDADHEFPCTLEERNEINRYLKEGFFYE